MTSIASGARFVQQFQVRRKRTGLGRTLIAVYRRLGFGPLTSYRLARWSKIALSPLDYLQRRVRARQLSGQAALTVGKDDYLLFPEGAGPDLSELVAYCDSLFEKKREAVVSSGDVPAEVVRFVNDADGPSALSPEEVAPIVRQVCRPDIVAMVADYIGEVPVLGNINLWYTPVNQQREGPQQIHRDMNARRQLHLVVAIRDIDAGCGPFTFLPGGPSRRAVEVLGHTGGRVPDEDFWACVSEDDMVPFTGRAGAALLVNPYACFHFGGRAKTGSRLVLIVSFTSRFESAEEGAGAYRLRNRADLCDGTPLQSALLDLPVQGR